MCASKIVPLWFTSTSKKLARKFKCEKPFELYGTNNSIDPSRKLYDELNPSVLAVINENTVCVHLASANSKQYVTYKYIQFYQIKH